jgi:CubicO group peptidase (beta-lactamase class C family)
MKNRLGPFHILCLLLFFRVSLAQEALSPAALQKLENTIHEDMSKSGAPGAVFAIVQGDRILYEKAFGVTNLETNTPTATNTVFAIASVTKFFTALALLTAMEERNFDVNTTIGSIVPGLSDKLSGVTVHHLLSHRAGILGSWPNTATCKDDLFEYFAMVGDRALFVEQGSVSSYSNNGYALAGLLLSKLKNLPYTQAIDSIVCRPLQMSRTTFDLRKAVAHSFATGHSKNPKTGAMVPTPTGLTTAVIQPAGGLFSTIHDLARLAICFMNDGVLQGKKLIGSSVIQKMSVGYAPAGSLSSYLFYPNSTCSYGSIVFDRKGIRYVFSCGEAGNLNSLFVMAPEHKTALIVLSNAGYHPFAPSIEEAMDLMLPAKAEPTKEFPRENREELVGKYYSPNIEGTKEDITEIFAKEGALFIRFPNDTALSLIRSGPMTYQFTTPRFTVPLEVTFYPDSSGKVKYLNYFTRAQIKLD